MQGSAVLRIGNLEAIQLTKDQGTSILCSYMCANNSYKLTRLRNPRCAQAVTSSRAKREAAGWLTEGSLGVHRSVQMLQCLDPGFITLEICGTAGSIKVSDYPLGGDHQHRSSVSNYFSRSLPNTPSTVFHSNKVTMHSKIAAFLLPLLAVANPVPASGSGSAPDPSQITIIDSAYSGNGCPQGSVSTSTSPDKTVRTRSLNSPSSCICPFGDARIAE